MILGSQTGIRSVLDVIVEKIRDKPDTHGVLSELKVIIWHVFVLLNTECLNVIEKLSVSLLLIVSWVT